MIGCLKCALAEVRVGSETKFGYEYSEEKDENGEVTKEWAELTDNINNLKKIIEEDKLTVNRINGADSETLYSIESFTKNEDGTGFDGATVTIGSDSYSTVNGENTDTFNLQNELDFSKNYEYDSDNRIISTTISALSLAYDYDDENVGSLSYSLAQGATKSFSYQYDENGNIISEQVAVDGVSADITAYEYDDDNQLVSAENSSTKWTYSYDNRGNMLSKKEYIVNVDENNESVYTEKANSNYVYDEEWKDKLTSYNGQTISYDASGNPTSYLGHSLSWTMGRQLASYDNIAYSYNESGIRTSKTVGENTTEFYLNGTNVIYQTDGTNDIYFFYDRNNELVGFKYENNNYFYVKNQMGDITDIANSNGEVVASYTYDPWGSVLSVTGSDIAIGNLNPFRYRSYYYDSDIQMYYLQSRYYDPGVGRFINCDDVNYIGLTESEISYNPFAYCENCPVNNSDFDGCLSFYTLKYLIKKAFATVKKWTALIIRKISNEIKRFVKIIRFSKGVLSIHTTIATLIIDAIVSAFSKPAEATMVTFGYTLGIAKNIAKSKLENFFKKQMVPYITKEYTNTFLTAVRKAFWKIVAKSTNAVLEYATAYTVDRIYERFNGYDIVSMFSSWGSFVSTLLDVIDGKKDNFITIVAV